MNNICDKYLRELFGLFGPDPQKIYITLQNVWADEINEGLHSCERKFKDATTVAQNHWCYYSTRLVADVKFINNLKKAATEDCGKDSSCTKKLMSMATAQEHELAEVKVEVLKYKKQMQEEKKK